MLERHGNESLGKSLSNFISFPLTSPLHLAINITRKIPKGIILFLFHLFSLKSMYFTTQAPFAQVSEAVTSELQDNPIHQGAPWQVGMGGDVYESVRRNWEGEPGSSKILAAQYFQHTYLYQPPVGFIPLPVESPKECF